MTYEETVVLRYLEATPDTFYTRREIARKAVKRQVYEEDQHWADAPLAGLLGMKLIEQNEGGLYRLKQPDIFRTSASPST